MRIKDITEENRPRERLERLGAKALSDAELLSVILGKGTKEENIIEISNKILSMYGINKLSKLSIKELQKIKGIGPAKASQIKAVFEFNKRHRTIRKKGKAIKKAKDVFHYFINEEFLLDREHFKVLHLNSKNKIVKNETISIGTLNASLVHPREVFSSAIKENANSIIIVHNHPSGDPTPSQEDIEITKILFAAGDLLGIRVLDHIIIAENKYYSFVEHEAISDVVN